MVGTGMGKQLTLTERKYIEKMYKLKPKQEIAHDLGIHLATLNRELNRCAYGNYRAKEAELDRQKKRQRSIKGVIEAKDRKSEMNRITKQIKACLQIDPNISLEEIAEITGRAVESIRTYYPQVKQEMMGTDVNEKR